MKIPGPLKRIIFILSMPFFIFLPIFIPVYWIVTGKNFEEPWIDYLDWIDKEP